MNVSFMQMQVTHQATVNPAKGSGANQLSKENTTFSNIYGQVMNGHQLEEAKLQSGDTAYSITELKQLLDEVPQLPVDELAERLEQLLLTLHAVGLPPTILPTEEQETVLSLGEIAEKIPFQASLQDVLDTLIKMEEIPELLKDLGFEFPMKDDGTLDFFAFLEQLTVFTEQLEQVDMTDYQNVAIFTVLTHYLAAVAPQADLHSGQMRQLEQFQQQLEQFVSTQQERVATAVEAKPKANAFDLMGNHTHFNRGVSFQTIVTETTQTSRSEELMKQLQAVLQRANFGQIGGANRIAIRLYPEHLGTLRIELHELNGVLSARILASSATAREMLDKQLHQLRASFTAQNLQVERIEVAQMLQGSERSEREQLLQQQRQDQQAQQQQQQHTDEESEEEFESFADYLIRLEEE